MADTTQPVNELSTGTPNLTDYLLMIGSSEEYKALVSAVAKKIVEDYAGSTLAGSAQSVQAALNSLNSNLANISSGTILDYVKSQVAAGVPEGHFLATSAVTDIPASGNWFVSYVRNTGSNIVQVKATQYNDSRVIYNTHIGNYQSSTAFAREWTQEPTRAEMDTVTNRTANSVYSSVADLYSGVLNANDGFKTGTVIGTVVSEITNGSSTSLSRFIGVKADELTVDIFLYSLTNGKLLMSRISNGTPNKAYYLNATAITL